MTLLEPQCHACGAEVYDIDVKCSSCGAALTSTGARRMVGGIMLGQYEVIDVIGQGGMSIVYKGKHQITGQEVALKILPPELAAHRDVKGRFLEEGRALAQLDHPNIVHLYNFGEDEGCLVLAMQFVRGVTWERLIMDQQRLPWSESVRIATDVASALEYAHSRGIIHRDMKPSNVLVRELDGAATVMDFGIAKMHSSSKLTATGQTMGTVRYMSPEQVRGQQVDERTDIYSLAMTVYESLVGDTPFDGETHFEIMSKHLTEAPKPPSQRGIECPPELEAVLLRAMAKKPEERQANAALFRQQLQAIRDGRPSLALDAAGSEPSVLGAAAPLEKTSEVRVGKRSRRLVVGTASVVGLAALATIVFMSRDRSERAEPVSSPAVPTQEGAAVAIDEPVALEDAFILPGLTPVADERFEDVRLRIVSTMRRDLSVVRDLVIAARASFETYGVQRQWPEARFAQSTLSLVLVDQKQLCDPGLYESERLPADCETTTDYYRARERTLYVAHGDEASLRKSLGYWVAASSCLDSKKPDCAERVKGYVKSVIEH